MFEELEFNDGYPDGDGYGAGFGSYVVRRDVCTGTGTDEYEFDLNFFDEESFVMEFFQRIMDV